MTYKTKSGDMWDLIAYRQLGSEYYVEALINANRRYIDRIIFGAGIELVIPEVEEKNSIEQPPWRKA